MHIQVWQLDSGLTLWINKGTSKETPDKKLRRAVESGCTREGALSQLPSNSRMLRSLENRSLTTYLDLEFCFPFLSSTFTAVSVDLPDRKVGAHEEAEPCRGASRMLNSGVASSPTGPAMAGPVFEICTFARRSMASTSVLRV